MAEKTIRRSVLSGTDLGDGTVVGLLANKNSRSVVVKHPVRAACAATLHGLRETDPAMLPAACRGVFDDT